MGVAQLVAENRGVPFQLAHVGACVRVEDQLVGVEAVPFLRRVRAMYAKPIRGAGADVGHVAVPDLVPELGQLDPLRVLSLGIKEANLDSAWR